MNRENIVRMVREAKQYAEYVTPQGMEWFENYNERFATLVASAEREACAQIADQMTQHSYLGKVGQAIRARGQL